ncbi:hypothetical protein E2C01_040418 [Portunus trituberculatus]|uniref:Uncharacterized protein n=1 Tax=Portunus trituberculatus TaxID=210409 RepID=A0A5B7FNQ7_PORTR|nr:hypothetical protein [Portunus trituberculatus]
MKLSHRKLEIQKQARNSRVVSRNKGIKRLESCSQEREVSSSSVRGPLADEGGERDGGGVDEGEEDNDG